MKKRLTRDKRGGAKKRRMGGEKRRQKKVYKGMRDEGRWEEKEEKKEGAKILS